MLPGNSIKKLRQSLPKTSIILGIFFLLWPQKKFCASPWSTETPAICVCVCMPALSGDRNSPGACRVQMASQLVMSHHAHPYQDLGDGRPNEEDEKTSSASQLQARPSWARIGCWKWANGNLGHANGAIAVEKSRSYGSFQNIHCPGRTWGERCCIITEQDG